MEQLPGWPDAETPVVPRFTLTPPAGAFWQAARRNMPPEDRQMPPEDRQMPPEDRQMPPEDRHVPPEDRLIPAVDRQMTPEVRRMPSEDRLMPPLDRQMPPVVRLVPPVNRLVPPVDRLMPPVDRLMPTVDRLMPPVDRLMPTVDRLMPPVDRRMSSEDRWMPTEDRQMPLEGRRMPSETLSLPGQSNWWQAVRDVDGEDPRKPTRDRSCGVMRSDECSKLLFDRLCNKGRRKKGLKPILPAFEIEPERSLRRSEEAASAVCKKRGETWYGHLKAREGRSGEYSRKVFLGGLNKSMLQEDYLYHLFQPVGLSSIVFPEKRDQGYVHLTFSSHSLVSFFIQNFCTITNNNYYVHLPDTTKPAQVIPWLVNDSNYIVRPSLVSRDLTVFVGGLHGLMTSELLHDVMHEIFGDVTYAGIDTDRDKYPIGSGRVSFVTYKSYAKAIDAEYLSVKTDKFCKTMQINPYLSDSKCVACESPGPYFCRERCCFTYYCLRCWCQYHQGERQRHRRLERNARPSPNETHHPRSLAPRSEVSDSRYEVPVARYNAQGMRHEGQDVRHEVQGVRHEVQGVRHEVQGVRHEVGGVRHEVQGVRHEVQPVRREVLNGSAAPRNHSPGDSTVTTFLWNRGGGWSSSKWLLPSSTETSPSYPRGVSLTATVTPDGGTHSLPGGTHSLPGGTHSLPGGTPLKWPESATRAGDAAASFADGQSIRATSSAAAVASSSVRRPRSPYSITTLPELLPALTLEDVQHFP